MHLLTPLVPDERAPLARANPVAKLAAAGIVLLALVASLDIVTAGAVLLGLAALLPFTGLAIGTLLRRSVPIGFAAVAVGVANVLFAAEQMGPTIAVLGPLRIGAETLANGVGLAVRLVAIVAAGLLATATSQPTALADSLVQQLHVSPRLAIGTLAALRLLPMLAVDWQRIAMARRARGVEGRSPVAAIGLAASRLLGLLVTAVRRGSRMATAMDARGFGALPCRSIARPQRMRPADWAWIGGAAALSALAIGVSVAVGTWRPLLG